MAAAGAAGARCAVRGCTSDATRRCTLCSADDAGSDVWCAAHQFSAHACAYRGAGLLPDKLRQLSMATLFELRLSGAWGALCGARAGAAGLNRR